MTCHRHRWAFLLAKAKNKTIPISSVKVCIKCGVLKIGKNSIKVSRYRLDMDGNLIINLGAPTASTDAARKEELDSAITPVNKGKYWVAHGDNVITFSTVHSSTSYYWVVVPYFTSMGGITTRNNPHTQALEISVSNESTTRGKIRIDGGYGFTSCGYIAAVTGTTERFDDVANTHTGRTAATTARYSLAGGYSLNGYGFTSCGYIADNTGATERFDDVANTHTARTAATARRALPAGYSLNGFGFTSCGYIAAATGTTERFDDVANTHTARTSATARQYPAGYSLNGFGFTSCGTTNVTERFDDVANTHTARTSATARTELAGYSLNGFGFTSCGYIAAATGTTERFDDVANTHTARTSATTARFDPAGYSLNGFGFTSCGYGVAGTTERFDDTANTHTARTSATARYSLAGYSTNEYFVNYVTYN